MFICTLHIKSNAYNFMKLFVFARSVVFVLLQPLPILLICLNKNINIFINYLFHNYIIENHECRHRQETRATDTARWLQIKYFWYYTKWQSNLYIQKKHVGNKFCTGFNLKKKNNKKILKHYLKYFKLKWRVEQKQNAHIDTYNVYTTLCIKQNI